MQNVENKDFIDSRLKCSRKFNVQVESLKGKFSSGQDVRVNNQNAVVLECIERDYGLVYSVEFVESKETEIVNESDIVKR